MAAAVQMVSLAMARAGLRCGIAILALMAPALATDLIPTSETRWDGFYVGAVLGGAWSDSDWRYDNHTGSIRSALRWWGRISTSTRAESSAKVRRDLIIRLAPGSYWSHWLRARQVAGLCQRRLGWSRCPANSVRPWDPGARQLERLRQWLDGRRRRIRDRQERFARRRV